MTLKEAISQLKSLKVYAEGEIPVYDTMRDNDDNVWVGDVQALGIAIEALEQRNAGCDFCLRRDFDYPGSHDFREVEDGLYFLTVSLDGKEWMRRIARNAGENCAPEKRKSRDEQDGKMGTR